ncbi:MAG: thermonuclease family protein [Thiomicrospira sp.]|uniref:thermonuclease family protein n=1 Tax=Thiomicrospira sp. TaxID=935 RepID=UPI0019E1B107|nr:thermonuclease family protein [Thiomicrospira sp.]MBE0493021.1 thermonuclease family protein [Thiomicrospira sp.]
MSSVHAQNCGPTNIDNWEKARIAQAGNVVIVGSRQYIMAGVYAPEMGDLSKRTDPPRPLSRESLTFLNRILANNDRKIGIEFDQQRMDGFGRVVAHLFLEDGRNVNELLLENGLGMVETNPPNLKYQECYFRAEQRARQANRGIWRLSVNQPELKFPVALSSQLSDVDLGFRIIRGEVRQVSQSRNNIIINLDTTGIRVKREDWPNFNYRDVEALKGQTIEVRGYGFAYQGAMYVVISHPNMIDKLNPYQP